MLCRMPYLKVIYEVLGTSTENIEKILHDNKKFAEIANDNSNGQIVISGKILI